MSTSERNYLVVKIYLVRWVYFPKNVRPQFSLDRVVLLDEGMLHDVQCSSNCADSTIFVTPLLIYMYTKNLQIRNTTRDGVGGEEESDAIDPGWTVSR